MNKNLALFSGILRKSLEFFNKLTIFPPHPPKTICLASGPQPRAGSLWTQCDQRNWRQRVPWGERVHYPAAAPGAGRARASLPPWSPAPALCSNSLMPAGVEGRPSHGPATPPGGVSAPRTPALGAPTSPPSTVCTLRPPPPPSPHCRLPAPPAPISPHLVAHKSSRFRHSHLFSLFPSIPRCFWAQTTAICHL